MDDETVPAADGGDPVEALGAWLLAEDAYTRGGVPDEVLIFLQDHVGRLLGPQTMTAARGFLEERLGPDRDLAGLARDRSVMVELLAVVEGRRRPGFEFEWRAFPPDVTDDRPATLLVMAEYCVGDPVWERPRGSGSPVSLRELGVEESLVRRLRAWNETFERFAPEDADWTGDAWADEGLDLARELQRALPDVEVRYFHADDDRPLREQ
ncbi:hypothetical protein [Actinoplanes sp. G11-F43]|uniref:hypothetical protein n=1 Tax=Actinoplanes sp. G11-F43 TaxID=3424130 RepID=UPI003D32812B